MNISALFRAFYERVYRSDFGVPLLLTLLFEIRHTCFRVKGRRVVEVDSAGSGPPCSTYLARHSSLIARVTVAAHVRGQLATDLTLAKETTGYPDS